MTDLFCFVIIEGDAWSLFVWLGTYLTYTDSVSLSSMSIFYCIFTSTVIDSLFNMSKFGEMMIISNSRREKEIRFAIHCYLWKWIRFVGLAYRFWFIQTMIAPPMENFAKWRKSYFSDNKAGWSKMQLFFISVQFIDLFFYLNLLLWAAQCSILLCAIEIVVTY